MTEIDEKHELGIASSKDAINLNDPALFINRELSMLDFQRRVLEEAQDASNPLLERVKFLSIVGSNLDEFFMVRVGGLKMQLEAGIVEISMDGLTPAEQLALIRKEASSILSEACKLWQDELRLELDKVGIHVLDYSELNEKQLENVRVYYEEVIFPVLTPLAYDPGHPFPHISNLSLNLAVVIRDDKGMNRFARVKVPATLPRLVPIKRSSGSVRKDGTVPYHHYFVWIEQVITANLDRLFPGMEVLEAYPFRVTRNADVVIQELEADDLLETMEESVRERRFGPVVSLSVNEDMPKYILDILVHNLEMDSKDIYKLGNPLGLSILGDLYAIDRYELKYPPFVPRVPVALIDSNSLDSSIFSVIRHDNILLHHPYDSFVPVVDFLRTAARDPNVLAIKQTLYRVGKNSPIVQALLEARRDYGKQVAVLVELKARFDEESNIGWARVLEREGVHVVYGLVGLKTHSKVALVVRKEGDRIRRYIHLGTGNYNAVTAHIYEDLGLFTCDDDIGADVTDLFNHLTGYSAKENYRKLFVAPMNLRERMAALIEREISHAEAGEKARLIFKMNSLVDKKMITLLYKASMAGVEVDLIVRGICCLRPGLKGISENIRVRSIVGRFLEHSRIYYFYNNKDEEIYMGSADLMPRNLDRRVEVVFPIEDKMMINRIRDKILMVYLKDNVKARIMQPDGSYRRVERKPRQHSFNSQEWFIRERLSLSNTEK